MPTWTTAAETAACSQAKLASTLPPPAQRKPGQAATFGQALHTPLTPPQRHAPRTPLSGGPGVQPRSDVHTPLAASSPLTRLSPLATYSGGRAPGSALTTPEQLRGVLDAFAQDVAAQAPSSAGQGLAFGQGLFAGSSDTLQPDQAGGAAYAAAQEQQEGLPTFALPLTAELPKYRPSWLPRAISAPHAAHPDVLLPSSEAEVDAFLEGVLAAPRAWLEVWTERLREWMASRLLQPLVQALGDAHTHVNRLLAQGGQGRLALPPLAALLAGSVTAGGAWAQGGAGGGQGGGPEVEVEAVLRHLHQLAQAAAPHQAQDALTLIKALTSYEALLALVRGAAPRGLLPPAPPAYVWSRIHTLAEGSCMPAFNWNGGGSWAGRQWGRDLPTDSSLLLYLFAAFLQAPGWQWEGAGPGGQGAAQPTGRGMPLFLGSLPARPPAQHSAVLAYWPDKPGKGVDVLLALAHHGGSGPGGASGGMLGTGAAALFCFLAQERVLVLSGSSQALFYAILSFLQYHKLKFSGALGAHFLQDAALDLASVIEPPAPRSGLAQQQSVWGWWFPPSRQPDHDKTQ
ncbi:cytochrome B561, N terminal-domain-containing protein [Haematococcus lacustris]